MKIFGYTDDKDVVAAVLPVDQIVDCGIDPWRLDLFESSPVRVEVGGTPLNFRPLSDVSFAYRTFGPRRLILGMHDGVRGVCVEAVQTNEQREKQSVVHAHGVRSDNWTFKDHLRDYLGSQTSQWWSVRPACALTLHCDSVVFDSRGKYLGDNPFCGEMLKAVTVAAELPDAVNFAFQKFSKWRPTVFGEALVKHLTGQPICDVDVLLDGGQGSPVNDSQAASYYRHPCTYRLVRRWGEGGPDLWVSRWADRFSVERLHSRKQNEVVGSRIALHDIAMRKARLLNGDVRYAVNDTILDRLHSIEAAGNRLSRDGFAIADLPFRWR